jgi:uncharacterized membrane protein
VKLRLSSFLDRVRTGFWAVPTLCVLVAVALALGLVALDRTLSDDLGRFTFGAGADGAREVLSAITTSMITFTGLVFSITIVVLQLTSSQFSPRVLRTFLRDRQTQLSLGVFIATFVYAVLVLRTVNGVDDDTFVPALATTVGVLLLLVSVGVFVAYIHHVATAIQVTSILESIGAETRSVLERRLPTGLPPTPIVVRPRETPVAVLPAPRSGVLTGIDTQPWWSWLVRPKWCSSVTLRSVASSRRALRWSRCIGARPATSTAPPSGGPSAWRRSGRCRTTWRSASGSWPTSAPGRCPAA